MSKFSAALVATGIALVCSTAAQAQKVDFLATGAPLKTAPVDKEIAAALRDVRPIRALVWPID